MGKFRLLVILSVLAAGIQAASAQSLLTLKLENVSIDSLRYEVKKATGYSIYYSEQEVKGSSFSINASNLDVVQALQIMFRGHGMTVSDLGNKSLIVSKGPELTAALPKGFFGDQKTESTETIQLAQRAESTKKSDPTTESENKVHTIGGATTAEQSGKVTLSGYVRDNLSGQVIAGAVVHPENSDVYVNTDAYGFYTMSLPRGEYKVSFNRNGYEDTSRQVELHGSGSINVRLSERVYALSEIVVQSERASNIRNPQMGVEKININRIKTIPAVFGEIDVLKVALTLPGVQTVGEASGGLNVRGGATDQNLILFNDGIIYNPTHLFGLFSSFNSDVVSDIELYKSSIPAQYGGRISSVLEVNSREGNNQKITGSASIGALTGKVHLEGPIVKDRTSFILGARTTYSDWLLGLLPKSSGYSNGAASFYDLNAGISQKIGERDQIYINGYYSQDRFRFDQDTSYHYQNANASIKWRHVANKKLNFVAIAGYDQYGYDTEDKSNPVNAYKLDFQIRELFGKLNFTWFANEKHTVKFGLNTIYYMLDPGNYTPVGSESLALTDKLARERATENALYVGDNWAITNKLSVDAGLRVSYYSMMGPYTYNTYAAGVPKTEQTVTGSVTVDKGKFVEPSYGPEFRISARYLLSDNSSIKVGFNSMRQNIHMLSNTASASPTDIWKLSDANIVPQTGWQAAGGFYHNFANNAIEMSLEGYYKVMNNYLDYRSNATLIMNPHIETDVIETQGQAYGVELMLKKSMGKLNGWISYAYSRTLLRQNDPTAVNPINDGDWYPAAYDKPHDVKLISNYKFTHRLSTSLNVNYATGRPITVPVSKYQYGNGTRVYYSERNAHRIPDYFRVDFSVNIEASHNLKLLTHSSFTFGVYNLTGRKNAYSVYYKNDSKGNLQGYMLTIYGAPIPYVNYNIKF